MSLLKWLVPGMNVKRWLVLLLMGVVLGALGLGLVMAYIYRAVRFTGVTSDIVYGITLQFIPRVDRAIILIGLGLLIVAGSLFKLSHSLLSVFLPNPRGLADVIYRTRKLPRGPRIVAIGGGTGLSNLLRGLKEYTSNLTAIVTVADDWTRQNPFRQQLGILPPGDFRNCIVALSDEEPLMARLFQYRFGEGSGLEGHSFGNLFIAALAHITGSFEKALREVGRVLAVRGQILPSTVDDVRICPDLGVELEQASVAGLPPRIAKKVRLEPSGSVAHPEAIKAIMSADMIVIGPGSIYTSVLPNLLVPGIREAIRSSRAVKAFVCNIATQVGDTEGLDVLQHVRVVQAHVGSGLFDYVVANDNFSAEVPSEWPTELVRCRSGQDVGDLRLLEMNVVDETNPIRHEPSKLSEALLKLYYDQASRRSSVRAPALVPAAEAVQTA
ncbi:MAG TPA: gluconeogenesis factor YvcK family protein [Chloroflexota bacterium]|nr:gluconeogenesis factor YvcK family protein [Chloroflexota bacterium]